MDQITRYYKNLSEDLETKFNILLNKMTILAESSDKKPEDEEDEEYKVDNSDLQSAAMNPSGNFPGNTPPTKASEYLPQPRITLSKSERRKLRALNRRRFEEPLDRENNENEAMADLFAASSGSLVGGLTTLLGAAEPSAAALGAGMLLPGAVFAGSYHLGREAFERTGVTDALADKIDSDYKKSIPASTQDEIDRVNRERHAREVAMYGKRLKEHVNSNKLNEAYYKKALRAARSGKHPEFVARAEAKKKWKAKQAAENTKFHTDKATKFYADSDMAERMAREALNADRFLDFENETSHARIYGEKAVHHHNAGFDATKKKSAHLANLSDLQKAKKPVAEKPVSRETQQILSIFKGLYGNK